MNNEQLEIMRQFGEREGAIGQSPGTGRDGAPDFPEAGCFLACWERSSQEVNSAGPKCRDECTRI